MIRRTFRSVAEARGWRQAAQVALREQRLRAPTRTTLSEAGDEWLAGAKAGVIRTRSGDRYKPSALRSYEQALRKRLLPEVHLQHHSLPPRRGRARWRARVPRHPSKQRARVIDRPGDPTLGGPVRALVSGNATVYTPWGGICILWPTMTPVGAVGRLFKRG